MKRVIIILIIIAAIGAGAGAVYMRRGNDEVTVNSSPITRGDIVDTVAATGALQAVTTVQVGSQVSGIIEALNADFNSMVRKGQVLAKLDQSTFASALEQAQASLVSAEAETDRLRVARQAADVALTRARELASKQLLPAADLQTAETNARSAAAMVVGAEAKVKQARSAVDQARVSLEKTVIASPIDGVVTARNVDVGQTPASTSPTSARCGRGSRSPSASTRIRPRRSRAGCGRSASIRRRCRTSSPTRRSSTRRTRSCCSSRG
jgi:HlyD family secretion protein